MAARKGKSQARRNNGGDHGLPGWAWLVLGVVLTAVVLLGAPKLLHKGEGDGFFRPTPNPDAQPAGTAEDEAIVATDAHPATRGDDDANEDTAPPKDTRYDFYTLLPSDEVPMSDAELEATARAEAARAARPQPPAPADDADTTPRPAAAAGAPGEDDATTRATPPATATAAAVDTPYLLQAGAFGASGDAEALKARIALLGLSARVESAQIGGRTVYRVRMGPYGTASELADAKRKLAAGGLPALAIKAK